MTPSTTPAPSSAPVLLRGGTVLTLDADASVLADADVLLADGRIAAIRSSIEPTAGAQTIDVTGHLVLPGLIQGHLHLGQTFFRGLAENRLLLSWLAERIWPLEAAHDDDSAYWCSLLGAAECLLSGTTCIQDIGIGPGIRGNLQAIIDSGLRALAGQCLMDAGETLPAGMALETDRALAATAELGAEFDGAADGRLRYALNPRFILSCSDDLWQGVSELATAHGWPIHTHALEQLQETELVRSLKGGRDEIEYFDDTGILDCDLRVAHGVWLDQHHYQRLRPKRFSVVHCPSSNLKLGSGIADIVRHRRAGITVGLGCDGAACSNGLDAFEEMRLAALLQRVEHGADGFAGLDAMRLATSEGARAIGLADEVGTLEVGKRADVVVLSRQRPEMWASEHADPHDLVCFSAGRAQVRHVLVDGRHLVRDGELTHLDLPQLRARAERACADLVSRSGITGP